MLKRQKRITDGIQKQVKESVWNATSGKVVSGDFFLAWYVAQWIYLGNEEVTKDVKK